MNNHTVLLVIAFVCSVTGSALLPLSSVSPAALWMGVPLFALGFLALALVVVHLIARTVFLSRGELGPDRHEGRLGRLLSTLLTIPRRVDRSGWTKIIIGAVLWIIARVLTQIVDDQLERSLIGLVVMNTSAVLVALGLGPALNAVIGRAARP